MGIGNFALAAGLALPYVLHPASVTHKDWMDGVKGLLLGVSIGLNLMLLWSRRRCRKTEAWKL